MFSRIIFKKLIGFGLVASAALSTQSALAQTKLTIGYTGANAFIPAFVAKDHGFFERRGLDVTLQLIPVGSTMPAALISNSLQVATLTAPVFLLAKDAGLDLAIVAGASYQSKQRTTAGAIARSGITLTKATDFKQRKVGVPGLNSVQHILFMKWLQKNGVKPKDVTFVEAAFPQMGDMLKGGSIDAALIVEPFFTRAQQNGSAKLAVSYGPQVFDRYLEAFYVMDKSFISKNPSVASAFKAAIRDAVAWTGANDDQARKTLVKYLKFPFDVAQSIPMPEFSADVGITDVKQWIDLSREFGLLQTDLKPDQMLAQ